MEVRLQVLQFLRENGGKFFTPGEVSDRLGIHADQEHAVARTLHELTGTEPGVLMFVSCAGVRVFSFQDDDEREWLI